MNQTTVRNERAKMTAVIVGTLLVVGLFVAGAVALIKVTPPPTSMATPTCVDGPGNVYDFVHLSTALPYVVHSDPGASYCRYEFPLLGTTTSNVNVSVDKGDAIAVVYDVYGTGSTGAETLRAVAFASSSVSPRCVNIQADRWTTLQACPVEVDVFAWEGLNSGGSTAVAKGQLSQLFPNAVAFAADSPEFGVPQTSISQAVAKYLSAHGQ